jgi:SAM-dependent methyltransferase
MQGIDLTFVSEPELVPHDDLIQEHAGDMTAAVFVAQGDGALEYLRAVTRLEPHHTILDVGCGCGKVARPLTRYLNGEGSYHGFDITAKVIDWCKQAYRNHANFHFHHADVHSRCYNPRGRQRAAEYIFPYRDEAFDVVYMDSVFTHMLPWDLRRYFAEVVRVMKRGGRLACTYFLLNAESSAHNAAGVTTPDFRFAFGNEGCRVESVDNPEAAIAYDEAFVLNLYQRHRLRIERTDYGEWGRGNLVPHSQDMVVAFKD